MDDPRRPVRFVDLLTTLIRHEVEFVVVGGVAAVLEGVPVATFDLDIVYPCEAAQAEALSSALRELQAVYVDPAGRRIEPTSDRLAAGGHHLLRTRYGRLDVMASVGHDQTFEKLLPRTVIHRVGGMAIRVLELAAIIATKEEAARPKDRATLPLLRETLAQRGG